MGLSDASLAEAAVEEKAFMGSLLPSFTESAVEEKAFMGPLLPPSQRQQLRKRLLCRVGHPFFSKERSDLCALFRSL